VTGPAELAAEAAESVRALNHATRPGSSGRVFPADAYDLTGALSLLASRLPQALAQLLAFLRAEVSAGRVIIVAGPDAGDPAAMLAAVTASLDAAVASAQAASGPRRRTESAHLGSRRQHRVIKTFRSWPSSRSALIMPGKITLKGGAWRHRVSDASAVSALDRDLARRHDTRAGTTAARDR
jgi:hypothetical protein